MNPTDRETHTYTAGTLYPGGMPPTEISLLLTALKLIACRIPRSEDEMFDRIQAEKYIGWAISYLKSAEDRPPTYFQSEAEGVTKWKNNSE